MTEDTASESRLVNAVCTCGHLATSHGPECWQCNCAGFRMPGDRTPTQIKGDEMAQRRGDKKQAAKTKAQQAAPSTNTKRRTLRRSKDAERWVAEVVGGKRTGQYGGTDVELPSIGIEVKNRPTLPKMLTDVLDQAGKHNKGTGRLSMGALVPKPGPGGSHDRGRMDGIFFFRISNWDDFVAAVIEDSDPPR